jgi:hypothetical protein
VAATPPEPALFCDTMTVFSSFFGTRLTKTTSGDRDDDDDEDDDDDDDDDEDDDDEDDDDGDGDDEDDEEDDLVGSKSTDSSLSSADAILSVCEPSDWSRAGLGSGGNIGVGSGKERFGSPLGCVCESCGNVGVGRGTEAERV